MKEAIANRDATTTTMRIKDLETAWFLIHVGHLEHLRLFIEKEVTVSQVSEKLGLDFNRAYAFVKRLLRLKLIKVARLEKRNGRPIHHYRSVADQFFVPFTLISLEQSLQAMSAELQQTMLQNFVHSELLGLNRNAGLQVMQSETGAMNCMLMQAPNEPVTGFPNDQPASMLSWLPLSLDFAQAKSLQSELDQLLSRYQHQTGAQKYLLHIGLCPLNGNEQAHDQLMPFNAFKGL
jgi:predicted transcriptional regulator